MSWVSDLSMISIDARVVFEGVSSFTDKMVGKKSLCSIVFELPGGNAAGE